MQIWNDKSVRSVTETKRVWHDRFQRWKMGAECLVGSSGPVAGFYRNVTPDSFEITVVPFGWITLKKSAFSLCKKGVEDTPIMKLSQSIANLIAWNELTIR